MPISHKPRLVLLSRNLRKAKAHKLSNADLSNADKINADGCQIQTPSEEDGPKKTDSDTVQFPFISKTGNQAIQSGNQPLYSVRLPGQ